MTTDTGEIHFCVDERVKLEKQKNLVLFLDMNGVELLRHYLDLCEETHWHNAKIYKQLHEDNDDPEIKYFHITLHGLVLRE